MHTIHLDTPIESVFRLRKEHVAALKRLNITTARDLLCHLPNRYTDPHELSTIGSAETGASVSIAGRIIKIEAGKTWKSKTPKAQGVLEDVRGDHLTLLWFSQPYMAKYVSLDDVVIVTGTLGQRRGEHTMINPVIQQTGSAEVLSADSLFATDNTVLLPVYPETRGISSRWLHEHIKRLLSHGLHEKLADPLPASVRETLNLPDLKTALIWVHTPKKLTHAQSARKRFAFAEIFIVQTHRERQRALFAKEKSYALQKAPLLTREFLQMLPFTPTTAQQNATRTIASELKRGSPMCRLLEGDVGSGKTAVAAAASYATIMADTSQRTQVAIMAPTEILARQHLETFIELFAKTGINIGFLAGSECRVFPSKTNPAEGTSISKTQLQKWLEDGRVRLVIGTHALIQKKVVFKELALVVIDEQHRFGITQRRRLAVKGARVPHLLSMTATPIPRTLALTIFGDLDLTVLDELPQGRKKTQTSVIAPHERARLWHMVDERLTAGEQIFVVCPRINAADPNDERALKVRSAQEAAEEFTQKLPNRCVDLVHGKLKASDKEKIMRKFAEGAIDVLVATSVIEVGVNIPGATMMIIEGAERFGLAQLHQLRGRVGRNEKQAYCVLVPNTQSTTAFKRLNLLSSTTSGFTLAEHDLMNRGAGALEGGKQWGMSDIAMEALKNMKLVERAKELARSIVTEDLSLARYKALKAAVERMDQKLHLE